MGTDLFLNRATGSLVGLALGDALGVTLEFTRRDEMPYLSDILGGGYHRVKAGEWTDDTSMALCLADSLIEKQSCDLSDQMDRYVMWWKEGYNSINGSCFDIGCTVVGALKRYIETCDPIAGSTDEFSSANGSLMRLAPVPIFFSPIKGVSLTDALVEAVRSSITTHREHRALECCEVMAWLLYQIYSFDNTPLSKPELFKAMHKYWSPKNIHPEVQEVIDPAFLELKRDEIGSSGFVIHSLGAALWCFFNTENFKDGALLAANLAEDADTTTAIYGQLAGAYYGYSGLPKEWLKKLAWHDHIKQVAIALAL